MVKSFSIVYHGGNMIVLISGAFLHACIIGATGFFVIRLSRALRRYRYQIAPTPADVPSVSVCIPARNEMHAMERCLENVLASDYPKFEVIVLDDSSVDQTPVLIKSFAHAGVRFVEGSPLTAGWLGKNHALEGLLHEASGKYILYLCVDTQIERSTISQLVAYAEHERAAMVSVLPRREDGYRFSVLFSPLRYVWELLLASPKRPATASAAWLIDRHVLRDELGGFGGQAMVIQPETEFAATLAQTDRYRFLVSTEKLGVKYEKKWRSHVNTSTRLLYRLVGTAWSRRRLGALLLATLALPPFLLAISLVFGSSLFACLALVEVLVMMVAYGLYCRRVWRSGWWLGGLLWPVIIIQEIILALRSVSAYKHGTVSWKGRPVEISIRPTVE